MKLIVGLGNVGKEYAKTRHNVGFMALDYFADMNHWGNFKSGPDKRADIAESTNTHQKIILVKPQTMMNDSGLAVQALMRFYKANPADAMLIYDELALPFGAVRIREGGSSAGHNGVKSLIQNIGDGFLRLRIGIDSANTKKFDNKAFVLARFSNEEEEQLQSIFDYTNHAIHRFISGEQLEAHTEKTLPNLI